MADKWAALRAARRTQDRKQQADITVQYEGSISVLRGETPAGRAFLDEKVGDENTMTWGSGIVVEGRYVQQIMEGALEEGLTVGPWGA